MKNIKKSTSYLIVVAFWMIVLMLASTKTQAQQSWCDSLSYSILIDSTNWLTLTVTGNADGVINMVDSIDWNFSACNALTCYTAQGNDPYSFPLITHNDTVKLCYDAFIYYNGTTILCNRCDSLVYDFMTDTWILFNRGNTVGIEELIKNEGMYNNKIYDMLGRELMDIPVGKMYIRNRKLYKKN